MLKTVVATSSLLAWPLVWPCVCLAQESRPPYSLVEYVQAQTVNTSSLKPSANFQPVWVWSKDANDTPLTMTQEFYLDAVPSRAELQVSTDNSYTAFVNGREFGKGRDWTRPEKYDISAELVKGINQLRLECVNEGVEAGAIAAIRLQYGSQVLVVGTSKSVVTMNSGGTVVPTSTKPANSSPWNLHKLESTKTGFVRAEANRLLSDLSSTDAQIAAKALGYLAYLSLEFPNLDLVEPTFSLIENSAVLPVPATDPLVARVRSEVVSRLDAPNHLVRGGAIAALTLLVSKSKDSKNLLEFITPSYCKACGTNIDLQLALLSGLNQRIASDSASFAKMVADAMKASEAKKAELDQAQAVVDAKETEIAKVQSEVIAIESKREQIASQKKLAIEEKGKLDKSLADLAVLDATDPIRIREEPIVVAKLKNTMDLIDLLNNRDGELLKSFTSSKNKIRRLTEDLDDLNITFVKLKKELDSLTTPVASVELFKRLDDIE
ncbi:MAG: coiled-coil domain-containing protein, partial [Pirellula staleyi]